jgi:hypothetical protein
MVKLVRITGSKVDVLKAIAELTSNAQYERLNVQIEVSKIVTKTEFSPIKMK